MRLHHLRMCAFGPFADDVSVDFDALAEDGLFLLHGPTGAGKTTILDAIAFALFGRVPGARHDAKRLHSDHASAQQVPEVELEATINGRRLRIVRSPEYHRPKKRGSGTTKVQAKATLDWVDGSGVPLTRLPEIGETISSLLGMSAEQFFQVVLLPQGDFSRFLRAANEDREALLQRLFDTERFGDVEEWFREHARAGSAALDEKEAALGRIAAQIAALADTETPVEPDMDWAQGCLDAARGSHERETACRAAARVELEEAQAAHESGTRLMRERQRGLAAQAKIAQLDEASAELQRAADDLAAARRAAPVVPVVTDHRDAVDALDQSMTCCAASESELFGLPEAAALQGCTDSDLVQVADTWAAESARLQPLARRVDERPTLVADIAGVEREIAAATKRVDEVDVALAEMPERRVRAADALSAARDRGAQLEMLRGKVEQIEIVGAALDQRDEVARLIVRAERRVHDAREAHNDARTQFLDLRERRLTGMAAELASQLVDGEPCVVCGSSTHPAPSTADPANRVSDVDERAASEIERRAADDVAAARSSLETYREREANLQKIIGDANRDVVAAEREDALERLTAAQRAAASISDLQRAVDDLEVRAQQLTSERSDLQSVRASASTRREALRGELASLDDEVAQATGGRVSVAARRDELAELCRSAASVREARAEVARCRERVERAALRMEEACADAGFADEDAVCAAMATPEQMEIWESSLRRAHGLRSEAQGTLDDEDVRAALGAETVDLEALATAVASARERHDTAAGAEAVAGRRVSGLADHVAQYWEALTAIEPVRAKQQELRELAELVSGRGQNARRMTLRSYVLAARLEEVLVAASARLRQMSAGRYEFAHTDAVGPRGRRGGLGIEVRDEYTGATRAATTLSGGETFFASLALALGLADVVSAESGGRVLDTMFIDEGFGTLDPESLDLVMGVLDELRSGGRVVGVVSHVDELRARIPSQLEVLRGEAGSSVRVRTLTASG